MKPKQRQSAILEYLQQHGKATVEQLTQRFNTTGTTIRKDLVVLEKTELVVRTYGGVMLNNKDMGEQPIDHKTHINIERKCQIARAAAKLIQEGDSLIFDAGSTVSQMIPYLAQFKNITLMTNSLHIVNELVALDNNQTILMSGGTYRKKSASFHNSLAESAFEKFTFDKLFMGADGVDLSVGVTTFNEVHNVSIAMCKAASQIILLVDSSKFGRKTPNVVCKLEAVHTLITDEGIDPTIYQGLLDKGIRVIITGADNE